MEVVRGTEQLNWFYFVWENSTFRFGAQLATHLDWPPSMTEKQIQPLAS